MEIAKKTVVVTGGASGLGEAVVRQFVEAGGTAVILDVNEEKGGALADSLEDKAVFVKTDVTNEESVESALKVAVDHFGKIDVLVNCAGVGGAMKTFGRQGVHDLAHFTKIININLIGTFNVLRLAAEKMSENSPTEQGERGVIINTASVAATDGQIGQAAYSASKGGIVGMTLPIARDLSTLGIRVMTIAPGIFETPLMANAPEKVKKALGEMVPFPPRLGEPPEFAQLALSIIQNPMLNGETIRLDGAIRMQPK
ncbi:3-hydroxyacyl-CoA dehydrogenase [Geomicrobium sp. JCM 19038]|uniref:3-hydroxyacyl-CoA dehydrogenase n=1 Tax=Geomicrobium sp. JCM 19038 TaxID=1460635 RepID=UPI00045F4027|nr:3-hydroxyacyl-CoA dehydrogenase [Geomicrobium sp. JCM 19038]GAK07952.1 3-hydroxyacyl-CoA dehydrogenase [Geomicrobium sp. JCM 19038]